MDLVSELYKSLDEQEKQRAEKSIERAIAKEEEKEDDDAILKLVRQILLMKHLTREEREREVKALLEKAGEKKNDLLSEIALEELIIENKKRVPEKIEEPTSEVPSFSYDSKDDEKIQDPYGGDSGEYSRADDYVGRAERSEFEELTSIGRSEFEESLRMGRSEYLELIGESNHPMNRY